MNPKIPMAIMVIYVIITVIFMSFFYERHKKQYDSALIKKDNTFTKMCYSLTSWCCVCCIMSSAIVPGIMAGGEEAFITVGCSIALLVFSGVSTFAF